MAATVTSTDARIEATIGGRGRGGNGFRKNGGNGNGHGREGADFRFSPARYRVGVWVAIAGIVMLFTALASAYIVRSASGDDWRPMTIPKVLWLSSALLIVSSITIEFARRQLKSQHDRSYSLWLTNTLVLGIGFVAAQLFAWRQFVKQGLYMASNPHSSFFYLFTGVHGVHVLGGLIVLTYLVVRTRKKAATVDGELRRIGAADAAAIYWHFMDGLWICLFLLLFFWK